MDQLIVFLMRLAALALRVDEAFFDDKVDRSIGTMRLNYYPAQAVPPAPGQLRASAHTDYGGFTILAGEDVPGGLQVLTRAGEWVDVATTPESFVVNIGDLLMRWTNDRWLSNMHRVVNPAARRRAEQAAAVDRVLQSPNYDARSSACRARARPSMRRCSRASTAI
jgi:isopenicillin N synthase-like dioxygenase